MIDEVSLRNALGGFATGVCVVSVAPKGKDPIGMTVNSFSSVSLNPPLVLWSIRNASQCFEYFSQEERFSINILSLDQVDSSGRYAKSGCHSLIDSDYLTTERGTPILPNSLTSLECRVWARYPGGDHLIIVGEVLDIATKDSGTPLVFYKGRYAQIQALEAM